MPKLLFALSNPVLIQSLTKLPCNKVIPCSHSFLLSFYIGKNPRNDSFNVSLPAIDGGARWDDCLLEMVSCACPGSLGWPLSGLGLDSCCISSLIFSFLFSAVGMIETPIYLLGITVNVK